eukprot:14540479-Alexandrium_andersonii.AAC.1
MRPHCRGLARPGLACSPLSQPSPAAECLFRIPATMVSRRVVCRTDGSPPPAVTGIAEAAGRGGPARGRRGGGLAG